MITDCYTVTGVMVGSLLGMWLERHFLKFEHSSIQKLNLVIFLVGGALVGLIYLGFSYAFAFLGEHWCHFVKYFAIFFTILYLYPLMFTYVRRR